MENLTAEEAWGKFREKVESLVVTFELKRRRTNHNIPKWMTREILRAITRKKRMWKTVRGNNIPDEYQELEKSVKNMIQRKFVKKLAAGGDGNKRPFFVYVKEKTKSRTTVGPLKDSRGTISVAVDMANLFSGKF